MDISLLILVFILFLSFIPTTILAVISERTRRKTKKYIKNCISQYNFDLLYLNITNEYPYILNDNSFQKYFFQNYLRVSYDSLNEVFKTNEFYITIKLYNKSTDSFRVFSNYVNHCYYSLEEVQYKNTDLAMILHNNLVMHYDYTIDENTDLQKIVQERYKRIVIMNLKEYMKKNPHFKTQDRDLIDKCEAMFCGSIRPSNKNRRLHLKPMLGNDELFGCYNIYFEKPLNMKINIKLLYSLLDNMSFALYDLLMLYNDAILKKRTHTPEIDWTIKDNESPFAEIRELFQMKPK